MKQKFLENMKAILGKQYESYVKSMEQTPKKAFRINTLKASESVLDFIKTDYIKNAVVSSAYNINHEDKLGKSFVHHAGLIYLQEPSSMMAVESLKSVCSLTGLRVLDMCAAPGGKTSQLAESVGEDGFVLANEKVSKRVNILRGNVERLGYKNVGITNLSADVLAKNVPNTFDVVLVDAPCSGEGMFRKDENAQQEWTEDAPFNCALRQQEILTNASKLLKTGGFLVYSTCTFNLEENEKVVLKFIKNNPHFKILEVSNEIKNVSDEGIVIDGFKDLKNCRRFYPFKNFGEGQFVCVMKDLRESDNEFQQNYKPSRFSSGELKLLNDFCANNLQQNNFTFTALGNTIFIFPKNTPNLKNVPLVSLGVAVCEIDKKTIKPHHNLFAAFGIIFKNKINLTQEDEINKYLNGEQLFKDVKDGYVCVMAHGYALGGGKAKNGVINNLYPKGLRN